MLVMTLTMLFDVLVACVRVCVCELWSNCFITKTHVLYFFLICCALAKFPLAY